MGRQIRLNSADLATFRCWIGFRATTPTRLPATGSPERLSISMPLQDRMRRPPWQQQLMASYVKMICPPAARP